MPIRRHCDPTNIKKIWDAIRSLTIAHQACDLNRIHKHFQKQYTPAQVDQYLQQAIKDGLILTKKNSLDPNATYKITEQEIPELDGKDWYCFECHLAGEVAPCKNCFRVFHLDCIKTGKIKFEVQKSSYQKYTPERNSFNGINSQPIGKINNIDNYLYDEDLCAVCNIINIDECNLDKSEVNYLLKFVLHRIRAWLPPTITHTMAEEDRPSWITDAELAWRAHQLFFEHRDMSVIEVNLNTESYKLLSEFLADILTVQHNVAIFHGIESQEYHAAEYMVRDTLHDIAELKNCSDCYKHSNEKINVRWFTLPCKVPHKLVWAKQKGYPYWPAKVIKESFSHCDVRFFGGKHERSLIHKSYVKEIDVTKESLKIKQSSAFTKAYDELLYHKTLLSDPEELERVRADVKMKRSLKPKTFSIFPVRRPMSLEVEVDLHKRKQHSMCNGDGKRARTNSANAEPEDSKNIINISDCEEDLDYSYRSDLTEQSLRLEENEQVSSSTECFRNTGHDGEMQQLDQPYSDSVEKMRRKLETLSNKNDIIKCAMNCMQQELDRMTNDHNEHMKRLVETHTVQLSETKKKQWCYNCEQDAIYHCCWNTAYCSQVCQQQHWQAEHKKVCRRKRQV